MSAIPMHRPGFWANWGWGGDGKGGPGCMVAIPQMPVVLARLAVSRKARREYNERRRAAWARMRSERG